MRKSFKSLLFSRNMRIAWFIGVCLCLFLLVIAFFINNHVLDIVTSIYVIITLLWNAIIIFSSLSGVIISNADIKKSLPDNVVIDLDADASTFGRLTVKEHKKGGLFKWNPAQVQFYLSGRQIYGKRIDGNEIYKEVKDKPIFNANLMDYLLDNQHLIPEEWKLDKQGRTRYICFWGTIYRNSDDLMFVRYIYWHEVTWVWSYYELSGNRGLQDYVAMHVSQ